MNIVQLEKVKELLKEASKVSSNLKNLSYKVLSDPVKGSKNLPSQRIIIFRLTLGMNREEFAKRIGITSQTLLLLENGIQQLKKRSTCVRYMKNITNMLSQKPSWEDVEFGYQKWITYLKEKSRTGGSIGGKKVRQKYGKTYFSTIAKIGARKGGIAVYQKYGSEIYRKMGLRGGSKGGKIGGISVARTTPLNEQEKLVLRCLIDNGYFCYWLFEKDVVKIYRSLKPKTISKTELSKIIKRRDKICEIRPLFKLRKNSFVVDFALFSSRKLKTIIECTRGVSHNISTYLNSVELCVRKRILQKSYPNLQFIAIISDKMPVGSILRLMDGYFVIFENKLEGNFRGTLTNDEIRKQLIVSESTKRLKPVTASQKILRTEQEKRIFRMLETNGFNFQFGFPITSNVGSTHFVDYAVMEKDKPKTIIEVTAVNTDSYKSVIRGALRIWCKIDFYKRYCTNKPNYVGVLTSLGKEHAEVYDIGCICDLFITNKTISKLPKLLNNIQKNESPIDNKQIIDFWKKVKG